MFAWALNRGLMFLKDFVVSFVWVIPVSPVGINVGDTRYTDLDYADDVVLFRNFIQELGSALQHFTQSPDTWDSAYCGRKQRYRTWVLETMLVMWLFAIILLKACPSSFTSGPSSPPWAHAQEIIDRRRLQLFSHVVRLVSNVPAHRALPQAICVRGNIRPDSRWRRPRGRPCQTWLHHIADGSPFGIRTEWHRAVTGSWRDGPLLSTRSNEWMNGFSGPLGLKWRFCGAK